MLSQDKGNLNLSNIADSLGLADGGGAHPCQAVEADTDDALGGAQVQQLAGCPPHPTGLGEKELTLREESKPDE